MICLFSILSRAAVDDLAAEFVSNYSRDAALVFRDNANAAWDYQTNITDFNQQALVSTECNKRGRKYLKEEK